MVMTDKRKHLYNSVIDLCHSAVAGYVDAVTSNDLEYELEMVKQATTELVKLSKVLDAIKLDYTKEFLKNESL